jgi:hypothetical protein
MLVFKLFNMKNMRSSFDNIQNIKQTVQNNTGLKKDMKTYARGGALFVGLTLLFSLGSCEKILDQKPLNEVDQDIAITDKSSANAAVAGLYNELQNANYYGANFFIIGDISTDIAQSIGTWDHYREMDTYQVAASGNVENNNFYTRAYSTVNIANNILEKIPALASVADADKEPMMGAAYFVRALALFDLTRLYGGVPGVVGTMGVPVITKATKTVPEVEYPARPALAVSYAAVEQDLIKALALLPETGNKSIASKGAARALLSRLYLYLGKNAEVITYSTAVITDNKYLLNPAFADIFASKLTTESIFELSFNDSDQSAIRNWYNPVGGRGDLTTHETFYAEATANSSDVRGKLYGFSASNGRYQTKYQKAGGVDNIHILRIAEMYLNRAEARAQTNDLSGALDDLDLIRVRAGIGKISPRPLTKADVLQAIWNEEKFEFAFEGHRLFDLTRTGQIMKVLQNISRKNGPAISLPVIGRAIFPIPNFELDANKNFLQNEAYR